MLLAYPKDGHKKGEIYGNMDQGCTQKLLLLVYIIYIKIVRFFQTPEYGDILCSHFKFMVDFTMN